MLGMSQDEKRQVPHGKRVGLHTYHHVEVLELLEPLQIEQIKKAIAITGMMPGERFNVIKLPHIGESITLLDYPHFFDEAFPVLANYWTVDLTDQTYRYRTYAGSLNPPVLHRKELLLPKDHPQQELFQLLTKSAEQIGLFEDPNRIGFKRAWETLLSHRGYKAIGNELIPIANDESAFAEDVTSTLEGIARHLTALTRYSFSAPMQALARFGFLDGSKSVFDYGCGRGDDLRGLRESNISADGWDPHYAPDKQKHHADLVNLGFVINVIEDLDERTEAIRGAYALAGELLVISAMLANQEALTGTPYADGVLTSRNTFQKYYTQPELRHFIGETLGEEPIPVGPGIFFVFKDKDAEQRFMYGRLENRRSIRRLSQLSRPERPARINRADAKYAEHREILESLWNTCLTLGRDPDRTEIADLAVITSALGSLPGALRFIKSRKERADEILAESRQSRIDDLRVYFAQLQFEKRKPYRHLELRLQRDIRTFFGDYRAAAESGRELLFSVADIEAMGKACHYAAEHGIGWLEDSVSLQVHTSMVEQLPPVLRSYIACGTALYGDVSSADLIKIHIRSAKLTLMRFDDFVGSPLPKMIQRVKLNLRTQDMQLFDYVGPFAPPYLYRKSRFINEEFPAFAEQMEFEEAADKLGLLNFDGYGPSPNVFDSWLTAQRYERDGFHLVPSKTIPELDELCGRTFTFRQLIHCGETWERTQLPNLPQEPETYNALVELAKNIIDPVVDYFGMINLTYGFCSPALAKNIPGRIAPVIDQHAGHEKKRGGTHVCLRLGAAIDFLVADEDMEGVANWIIANLPFDRLYFYGRDRPIHVSYGPEHSRAAYRMEVTKGGARIPRPYSKTYPN
jgi:DNA phosphorothioation-associated putative methyltransferase